MLPDGLMREIKELRLEVNKLKLFDIPLSNGALNTNLNADLLDGLHAATSGANAHVLATDSGGNAVITGNVGVGTDVLSASKFRVKPSTGNNLSIRSATVLADGIDILSTNDADNALKGMEFEASTYIFRTGNVGIGTVTPAMKLHVIGGAILGGEVYISPTNTNTLNSGYTSAADDVDIWLNYRGYNDAMAYFRDFRVGNGKGGLIAMFQGSTGNVGIGTTTVPSLLTVAGLINMKNYTVATLPAGTQGDICYCTDLLLPGFLAAAVGGGAVVGPVFKNASGWVSF